jgi:lipid II:glycine glycyltransferase (peptidoglycan interpeptide bridge formation enzyme)
VALPFSDFAPLLGTAETNPADHTRCLETIWPRVIQLGQQRGWRAIELRGGPPPTPEAQPCATFHGHLLDLSGGESALFNGLHPSVRRAIRKAQQSELRVESSHALDALHDYYALHRRTRQRHGLPPQPFKFFLRLYDQMIATGNAFIALGRLGVRAIAGAIFLHTGRAALYKYGASDPAYQSLRANDLLFWVTIRQLAADGFATLHFGRTDLDHEGLRQFKLGWGTREEPIHYYQFNLRANAFVPARDRASTRNVAWFGRLPLAINRLLGAFAYPHLD